MAGIMLYLYKTDEGYTQMRYKITDIDNETFYQLPKSLFTQKNYKGLSSDAKIIYAMLKDRMKLSRKNKWQDRNGDIFLLFTQPEIGALLDLSASSVSRAMKKLQEYNLIDFIRQGLNRPNKIYINKVEVPPMDSEYSPSSIEDEEDADAAYRNNEGSPVFADLHICNTGLAPLQVKSCTTASQDLHVRDSRLAPVQSNKTDINKTDRNNTKKSNTNNNNNGEEMCNKNEQQQKFVVVVELLKKYGATENKAMELVHTYGVDSVQQKLYLLSQQNNISNAVGFVIQALREDYQDARIVAAEHALSSRTEAKAKNERLREESLKQHTDEPTERERKAGAISKANAFQGIFCVKYNLKFGHEHPSVQGDTLRNILVDVFLTEKYPTAMLQQMVNEYFNTRYDHPHDLSHFLSADVFSCLVEKANGVCE